jgi:hypothetical protein
MLKTGAGVLIRHVRAKILLSRAIGKLALLSIG